MACTSMTAGMDRDPGNTVAIKRGRRQQLNEWQRFTRFERTSLRVAARN